MYQPSFFMETDTTKLVAAARSIQLACIVTATAEGQHASHVPVVVKHENEKVVLEFHVAKANPHWKLAATQKSIAVFQGPDAYVHPGWYPTKAETGRVVPTWTYVSVHMHGWLETISSEEELHAHLADLTNQNESDRPESWVVEDAPTKYLSQLKKAIVGMRMHVDHAEGAWKLNQHKSDADRAGVIQGMTGEASEVAELMTQAVR